MKNHRVNGRPSPGRPRLETKWTKKNLLERADHYFRKCDNRTKTVMTKEGAEEVPFPAPYTLEGLCCYLGICRKTFWNWRREDSELGRAAESLHLRITANRIEGALDGTQSASFSQFLLKNCDAEFYRDKVEVNAGLSDQAEAAFEKWMGMFKDPEAQNG